MVCDGNNELQNFQTGEAIALGFQHYILALGTAVMIPSFLVPLMGGSDVSKFFDFKKMKGKSFLYMIKFQLHSFILAHLCK